ncbi:MAG TPA: sarcosine oxidase subunit gamma family protein, partial [Gaiellales bacterium]|nr:sarcosine oxidase subunit gamma family protein [Gaiellales bacterium]
LCPFSRVGALRERIGGPALDVSSAYAAVALGGERRRDVFHRSSGLDVRESRFGAGRCMAGSVMRVPTIVLNRGDDLVMLVAWEYGEYFWEAILDAGETIGIARTSVVAAAAPQAEAQEQEQTA